MKANRQYQGSILIAIIGFLIIGCVLKWKSSMFSPVLLYLTLVAILWYSWETRGMKMAMIAQNGLSMRPRLVIIRTPGRENIVKNIGKGPALEIDINDYEYQREAVGPFTYRFKCQNILDTGATCELVVCSICDGREKDLDLLDIGFFAAHTAEIRMEYKDLMGNKYTEDISSLGKDMLEWETFQR